MIIAVSNVLKVVLELSARVQTYQDPNGVIHDKLIRSLATSASALVRQRVHVEGKKTDGSNIGTYESSYLKTRVKKYNRTSDSKMIFSLTRQMENDLSLSITEPIKTEKGYGIGFKNIENMKKALYLQNGQEAATVREHTRKGRNGQQVKVKSHSRKASKGFGQVYNLTNEEKDLLLQSAKEFIEKL